MDSTGIPRGSNKFGEEVFSSIRDGDVNIPLKGGVFGER
jgi:hypothetical protein